MSETFYNIASKIPLISSITKFFVMRVFFEQFLGGETTEDCSPKIQALRQEQIGVLLGYNIEAELDGSRKDPSLILDQTQKVLESIELQAKLAREICPSTAATGGDNRFWVRVKVSGLLPDPIALLHGSMAIIEARQSKGLDKDVPYPGLPHDGDWEAALSGKQVTAADRRQLLDLYATLDAIMTKGRDNNIRIVIDAEQTWYQPVIDSLTDEFMQKYNTIGGSATCIASFQAYLRRYPQLIDQQVLRAQRKGYKLLFKQVRGAYIKTEAERWRREGREGLGPVWDTKADTDASFNYGLEKALSVIHQQVQATGTTQIGAIFATHNSHSIDLGIQLLEKYGLSKRMGESDKLIVANEVAGSIAFGQLYGMKDDLTNRIAGSIETADGFPLVVKRIGQFWREEEGLARRGFGWGGNYVDDS
ncbi:hypothetical protein PLIIFM63780_002433 [Purpureocillium lilacinum]|nr:hypothetical protein PLIIFM63780_002433 [Purpureocillium lilacinum]